MRVIEVRVRTFHTDGDIDVTPSASLIINADVPADAAHAAIIKTMNLCDGAVKDAPIPGLRLMTPAEVGDFLETERAEESGSALVISN